MSEPILVVEQMNYKGYHPVRYQGRNYYLIPPFDERWEREPIGFDYWGNPRPGDVVWNLNIKFKPIPEPANKPKKKYSTSMGLRKPQ